jgi:hypothetical protein
LTSQNLRQAPVDASGSEYGELVPTLEDWLEEGKTLRVIPMCVAQQNIADDGLGLMHQFSAQ